MRHSLLTKFVLLAALFLLTTGFSFSDITPGRIEAITSTVKSIGKATREITDDVELYMLRVV
jgi:hypothetical protein